jgi:hypothetical protein
MKKTLKFPGPSRKEAKEEELARWTKIMPDEKTLLSELRPEPVGEKGIRITFLIQ